jgi:hypothetical protein
MLTDYALAGVVWMLARALRRSRDSRAAALWAQAFEVTALAALAGGSVHGFGAFLPRRLERVLWVGTVMSVGLGSACLLAGVVFAAVRPGLLRRFLLALCSLKLAVYLAWVALHPDFRYAVYDSLPGGLLVLGFLVQRWSRRRSQAAALGVLGLLLSIAGAILQQTKLGIHPVWFNHNDLYHVIQAGALWLLHLAGRELRDAR